MFPVTEQLLKPVFGGISRDSLVGCVGGGLDRLLFSRLELDESEGPLVAPLCAAECNELRALCCSCDDGDDCDDDDDEDDDNDVPDTLEYGADEDAVGNDGVD